MGNKQKYECMKSIFEQFDDYVRGNCRHFSLEPARCDCGDNIQFEYRGPNDYMFYYERERIFGRNAGTICIPDMKSSFIEQGYEVAVSIGQFWDGFTEFVDIAEQNRDEQENSLLERIVLNKLQKMAEERDELAARERECESKIFDKDRIWAKMDMDEVLKCYHNIKIDRAALSEAVAREFMKCSPKERRVFACNWFETDEGKRKLRDL